MEEVGTEYHGHIHNLQCLVGVSLYLAAELQSIVTEVKKLTLWKGRIHLNGRELHRIL